MQNNLTTTIDQIQNKLDIVEIIGSYVPLKKAGANYKANCPFHNEKTASFMVSQVKQIYHCFGCGAGGDMISFVMRYERLEFMGALTILADKAKVEVPKFNSKVSLRDNSFSRDFYKINEIVSKYYNALLISSTKSKNARAYLSKRGIDANIVSEFKIGYASEEWEDLLRYCLSKGISNTMLHKAGLVIPGRKKGFYDRFRDRIIFPIFDVRSNIIGFGGRVLSEDTPKYINSPETEFYKKGQHLYGMNFAVEAVKKEDFVIIVEGYFDLITPYKNGIKNIVAALGTALTVEQIRLIKRFTQNVVIVFDSDTAGEAASLRGLDLLISEGLNVKIASLPKGYDPDSFINDNSAIEFLNLLKNSKSLFDYKLGLLMSRSDIRTPEGKAKISSEMLPTLKRMKNAVLRADYVRKLADIIKVREDALMEEFSKAKVDYNYKIGEDLARKKVCDVRPFEKSIIALMLDNPRSIEKIKGFLTEDDFRSDMAKIALREIFKLFNEEGTIAAAKVLQRVDDERISNFICEAVLEVESITNKKECLEGCIKRIKESNLELKRAELTDMIRDAEKNGKDYMKFIRELDSLKAVN